MSMEHRAFLFDTERFYAEIEPVMRGSIKTTEVARNYIYEHLDELQSPYTGDVLGDDWESEFSELNLQVYFDILLTACYEVDDDCGLCEMGDAVNGTIKGLDVFGEPEIAVLGRGIVVDDVQVDPGMMGLGIVESHEVPDILDTLMEYRDEAEDVEPEDLFYDVEPQERMEAYDDLCALYEEAARQGKGLLFTF